MTAYVLVDGDEPGNVTPCGVMTSDAVSSGDRVQIAYDPPHAMYVMGVVPTVNREETAASINIDNSIILNSSNSWCSEIDGTEFGVVGQIEVIEHLPSAKRFRILKPGYYSVYAAVPLQYQSQGAEFSFHPETPVMLPDGTTKRLVDIQIGDEIDGGMVTDIHFGDDEYFALSIGARGVAERILTTRNHPFWVNGSGWVPLHRLTDEDELATRAGPAVVAGVETTGESGPVINLTVDRTNTFRVGHAGLLAHNQQGVSGLHVSAVIIRDCGQTSGRTQLATSGYYTGSIADNDYFVLNPACTRIELYEQDEISLHLDAVNEQLDQWATNSLVSSCANEHQVDSRFAIRWLSELKGDEPGCPQVT